jgi:hypothetical protein
MARLARAAYSTFETDGGTALREQLAADGLSLIATFHWIAPDETTTLRRAGRDRGGQAYLAGDDDRLLLIFRGSTDTTDWVTNLQTGKRTVKVGGRAVRLHAGFLLSYRQMAEGIDAAIAAEMARRSRPLVIVGHSLGGALAQIAAAVSPRPELEACYSFGAPRVAASWFRRALTVPHYRVVNGWDVVPIVPPALLGYAHTGPSYHLRRDPPGTRLGRGRSPLRTLWIYLRSAVGMAFGRPWAGVRDHETDRYVARLDTVAARPGGNG